MTGQSHFFRSLFSPWGFARATTKFHRLKPVLLHLTESPPLSFRRCAVSYAETSWEDQ
jgi:hypothetical protein